MSEQFRQDDTREKMNSLYMTQDEQKQTAFRQEALYSLLEPTAIVISSLHLVLLQVSGYPLTFPMYLNELAMSQKIYSLTLSYSFILLLSGYWRKPMQWLHWDPSAPVTLSNNARPHFSCYSNTRNQTNGKVQLQ